MALESLKIEELEFLKGEAAELYVNELWDEFPKDENGKISEVPPKICKVWKVLQPGLIALKLATPPKIDIIIDAIIDAGNEFCR